MGWQAFWTLHQTGHCPGLCPWPCLPGQPALCQEPLKQLQHQLLLQGCLVTAGCPVHLLPHHHRQLPHHAHLHTGPLVALWQ